MALLESEKANWTLAEKDLTSILIAPNDSVKTLGLKYAPSSDKFSVSNISLFGDGSSSKVTKRSILSETSKLFDPLGFIGPLIVKAKLIIQELWKFKLQWDESVPQLIYTNWRNFCADILSISDLEISRFAMLPNPTRIELHGFADASEKAYGACIYLRSINAKNEISCHLLIAKSRVAPLHSISIPRLELCATVILSRLLTQVKTAMCLDFASIGLWTDSEIALSWIHEPPFRWKTFVANRVAEIQTLTSDSKWRHIESENNPADLISRGVQATQLMESRLWWHGPEILQNPEDISQIYSKKSVTPEEALKERKQNCVSLFVVPDSWDLFSKYSTLDKLQRVFAYVQRFLVNCRRPKKSR